MKYINEREEIQTKTLIEDYPTIVVQDKENNLHIFSLDSTHKDTIINVANEEFVTFTNPWKWWEEFLIDICSFDNFKIIDKFEDNTEYEITITRK